MRRAIVVGVTGQTGAGKGLVCEELKKIWICGNRCR
jgi:uridine kinase